jgi:hypothetical protein
MPLRLVEIQSNELLAALSKMMEIQGSKREQLCVKESKHGRKKL